MPNLPWTRLAAALVLSLAACAAALSAGSAPAPVTLRVGHVGHDHHTALYVALENASAYAKETGITLEVVERRRFYRMSREGSAPVDLEIILVGGGSKMPTALAQGVIDIGLGGVAPVYSAVDRGAPIKLIAPLHFKGDMFVLRPDFPAATWEEFVKAVKASPAPVRIGYKNPLACAKIIFEEALRYEGLTFTGNLMAEDVNIQMINVKGGSRLNVSLSAGLIDGYAANNPFPEIGLEKGILRIVSDLEDLPPGKFRDHPCCCVAANAAALDDKSAAVENILVLLLEGTETINSDSAAAAKAASAWIGTSEELETRSIASSGYSMSPSEHWHETMAVWMDAMNALDVFTGSLKGLNEEAAGRETYDFRALDRARARLRPAGEGG